MASSQAIRCSANPKELSWNPERFSAGGSLKRWHYAFECCLRAPIGLGISQEREPDTGAASSTRKPFGPLGLGTKQATSIVLQTFATIQTRGTTATTLCASGQPQIQLR